MSNASIHFVCVAEQHQRRTPGATRYASPLTIHNAEWAYCPAGLTTEHSWNAIAPMELDDIRRNWRTATAGA